MSKQSYDIAVVGATGAVGESMLSIIAERNFPAGRVHALASRRSAGKTVAFGGGTLRVEELATFDFRTVRIALFSASAAVSEAFAAKASAAGCVVIDNTSYFRRDPEIPLVIPEVNPGALAGFHRRRIVANPNCSTIQMLVALKPIYDAVGISRINVATYQAVSGAGKAALNELLEQSRCLLDGRPLKGDVFPKPIAFNALPHIDSFQKNGYTREEMKMIWETQKIFDDATIQVNPTCVRVPVVSGHSEAVHIETREKIDIESARALLRDAPGVVVMDGQAPGRYPTALTEAADADPVFVGRIREDLSHPRGLNLWIVSDSVRKGGALNAVQIAEMLIKDYL